jgi:magnesium transporter
MLRAYRMIEGRNVRLDDLADMAQLRQASWVDLLAPTPPEMRRVESAFGLELPSREEMREIELSSRVYRDEGGLFLTATVLCRADAPVPELMDVTFIFTGDSLITLRYDDPKPFYGFHHLAQKQSVRLDAGVQTFMTLVEAVLDRVADVLETTGHDLNAVAAEMLTSSPDNRGITTERQTLLLRRIARAHDLTAKARESLVTLARILSFAAADRQFGVDKSIRGRIKIVQQDLQSLSDYTVFLSGNISFQLDALLGLVGIEQNNIVKIFSVAAAVFMPPTLVASIYGMNFEHMPELQLTLGYPLALLIMVLSAVLPYLYFRRRGWL